MEPRFIIRPWSVYRRYACPVPVLPASYRPRPTHFRFPTFIDTGLILIISYLQTILAHVGVIISRVIVKQFGVSILIVLRNFTYLFPKLSSGYSSPEVRVESGSRLTEITRPNMEYHCYTDGV